MASKVKQWTFLTFTKMLKKNNYKLDRIKGSHYIYTNNNNNHISVPINLVWVIATRLIKENNLNTNL